ncbi:MAG: hypothetical protein AAGB03_02470 [Pseudomonadota bacterium]
MDAFASFSSIPLLLAGECAFMLIAAGHAARARKSATPWFASGILCTVLVGWGIASLALEARGFYDNPQFLALWPGFVTPLIPIGLLSLCLLIAPVRRGLVAIADTTPAHWFVLVQTLRIAAIGTLYKTWTGAFPVHVELAVGLNDLAFGLSALAVYALARAERLSSDALVIWHAVGVALIVIPGEIAIQMGLHGPIQHFSEAPTTEVMFDSPLVLAPSAVVPAFVLLNLFAIYAALRQRAANGAAPPIAITKL